MKNCLLTIVALIFFATTALYCPAQTNDATYALTFAKAQEAYDTENMEEAIQQYESLIGAGCRNPELFYNLANSYFKSAKLPEAVWHYRKAWYAAPRDPDIQANLRFALNAANAIEPSHSFTEKVSENLSKTEWLQVAIGSYSLLCLLSILAFLIRPARRVLFKAALLPIVIILIASFGWWHWHLFNTQPEVVIVRSGATVLHGPLETSTAYYKIPAGAIARQKSINPNGKVQIEYDGKVGFLKEEYVRVLYP